MDDSFDRARAASSTGTSPEYPTTDFHCGSWLLDPQLVDGLPEKSNMAQFGRRWRLYGEPLAGDEDALFFTFHRRGDVDLDTLPRDTSLQRLIIDHLRAGRHWHALARTLPHHPTERLATMTEVYLIRHGETEWSKSGQHTSITDLPLTEQGIKQAESLRGHLDPEEFGLVLSSPRQRAIRTAELAGFTGPYEPQVDDDLVEWAYGDYEGLTSVQIHESVPDWDIFTGVTPGGETHDQVTDRLDRVVDRIQESGRGPRHLLRPRARPAGLHAALAGVRRVAGRALPAGHRHGVDPRVGEAPAGAGALELPPLTTATATQGHW